MERIYNVFILLALLLGLLVHLGSVLGHKCSHIEFTLASLVVHEPHLAEYRPLAPTLVVQSSNRPLKEFRKTHFELDNSPQSSHITIY